MILEIKIRKIKGDDSLCYVKNITEHSSQITFINCYMASINAGTWDTALFSSLTDIISEEECNNIMDVRLYSNDVTKIYTTLKNSNDK